MKYDKYNSKMSRENFTKKEWFVFAGAVFCLLLGSIQLNIVSSLFGVILIILFLLYRNFFVDRWPSLEKCISCNSELIISSGMDCIKCLNCETLTAHRRRQFKVLRVRDAYLKETEDSQKNFSLFMYDFIPDSPSKNGLIIFCKEKVGEKNG